MLYYKRRVRKISKVKKIIISIIVFVVLLVCFVKYIYLIFVRIYNRTQAEILSTNSVSNAVNATLNKLGYNYNDISKRSYDSQGNVKSIQTDSIKINKIKSSVTKAVQKEIAKVYDNEIKIPSALLQI